MIIFSEKSGKLPFRRNFPENYSANDSGLSVNQFNVIYPHIGAVATGEVVATL